MQPFLDMKSERDRDINDGVRVRGLERSKLGSITQFMSPPIIRRLLFSEGRHSKSLFIKCGSSKLGAYMLSNKMGTWNSVPVTIKYLPFLSDITLEGENWIDLPIKIATPLALELKSEWNTSETHGHLSLTWSLVRMWVSCRNTRSALRRFKCANILDLLIGLPMPLIFQLKNLTEDPICWVSEVLGDEAIF